MQTRSVGKQGETQNDDNSEDIVEITAALMHVIDYLDTEHRREVHGTV